MKRRHDKGVFTDGHPDYDMGRFLRVQDMLSGRILERECEEPSVIAGADVAYDDMAHAACVVCDRDMVILKEKTALSKIHFPYLPTFFSFREFPPIVKVLSGLEFDLLFVHGHGRAHPRFFGLASHVGLHVAKPTIGIASRPICGEIVQDKIHFGGKVVAARVGRGLVSVGNLITLPQACEFTRLFSKKGFPFVLRRAHILSERLKNAKKE